MEVSNFPHKGAYFSRLQIIREFVYLNTLKCHHHEVVNGPILNGAAGAATRRITSATRKMIGSL